ncbi:MAG: PDDEXK nuclease domain-containing protein [Methylobacter sp.]|nr:PDDEXK nuclease domain-containing protein [Candidatus Methylobacter titanis]
MSTLTNTALLNDIRQVLITARQGVVQAVNSAMVQTYWQIGRLIIEHEQQGQARAEYGKQQLEQLSQTLQAEFGQGFDITNLRRMRTFYELFPIRDAVRLELSWTHYRTLIRIVNPQARDWYATETIANHWSARALERQISTLYYERLLSSTNKAPVAQEAAEKISVLPTDIKHYLRDPYILDFLNLPSTSLLESTIEQGLIDNLQQFLLELGRGFAFVSRQQRISVEDQDFYLDLVFYNFKLKCFLLIDLKLGKLTHQDVGQMDTYVRIYDQHHKGEDDNPSIGLILCSEKSAAVAKYSVLTESKQLFSAKYLPYLPTEEELRIELQRERALLPTAGGDE